MSPTDDDKTSISGQTTAAMESQVQELQRQLLAAAQEKERLQSELLRSVRELADERQSSTERLATLTRQHDQHMAKVEAARDATITETANEAREETPEGGDVPDERGVVAAPNLKGEDEEAADGA